MSDLTPAMQQYMDIKKKYPDSILFYRMGDFFETFYEDAKLVSKELDIALTSRNKGETKKIPMAGIPVKSLETHLANLVKKGHKVAICDQIEDADEAKGRIVERDVVRVVTPGTVIEQELLEDEHNNYICAINHDDTYGISFADVSTGEFIVTTLEDLKEVRSELSKFDPAEIVIPISMEDFFNDNFENFETIVTTHDDRFFWQENAYETLTDHFDTYNLKGFGIEEEDLEVKVAGGLLSYLKETQKNSLKQINELREYSERSYMVLDDTTQRNLELVKNLRDNDTKGTLLRTIDQTVTSSGGRLIKKWILRPLIDREEIEYRQQAVEELFRNPFLRNDLRDKLEDMKDIERLFTRITYSSANAKDLIALKNSLDIVPQIKRIMEDVESEMLDDLSAVKDLRDVRELIDEAIKEDPPAKITEGGIIKDGYSEELDKLRETERNGKQFISDLEKKEKEKTGIDNLKIEFNKVHGYYIEVTQSKLDLVPDRYTRKQTLKNRERYITSELKEMESKILGASEKIEALEHELFKDILKTISESGNEIKRVAEKISKIDVLLSLAKVAEQNDYVKPDVNNSYEINMKSSRHPVLEEIEDVFVPNDVYIGKENMVSIITGPNMAGKSTYMRQVALNVLLAQIGSFVAADDAEIGIVDRIFTRVGARDELISGQSTFMVEMNEAANILNNATENSLIILDEIGRGTSTYDGVSLAWSIGEYIHDVIRAKTLFATHYHELNHLEGVKKNVKNYKVIVKEEDGEMTFVRKIREGSTDRSYGIKVAKLAGLPDKIIDDSKKMMRKLRESEKIIDGLPVERSDASKDKSDSDEKKTTDEKQAKLGDMI